MLGICFWNKLVLEQIFENPCSTKKLVGMRVWGVLEHGTHSAIVVVIAEFNPTTSSPAK